MVGRRPLPTQYRRLTGNAGHRPIIGDDVEPEVNAPEMPEGLSRAARREFRFMCQALLHLGLLTVVDGRALAIYCEAFAQKQKARKELDRLGAAIEVYAIDKSGQRVFLRIEKNPWWSVWVDACKLEKAFLIEFGLTPASRRNLKITIKTEENELERLIKRSPVVYPPLPLQPPASRLPIPDWPGSESKKDGTADPPKKEE